MRLRGFYGYSHSEACIELPFSDTAELLQTYPAETVTSQADAEHPVDPGWSSEPAGRSESLSPGVVTAAAAIHVLTIPN